MSVVVILTARAKEDQYETLVATFKVILPDTAARDGAELIRAAADPDDKAACTALTQRIETLGQQYLKTGGRYKFQFLVKKMTEPW